MKIRSICFLLGALTAGLEINAQCTPTLVSGACRTSNLVEIQPIAPTAAGAFVNIDATTGLVVWGNTTTAQTSPTVASFRAARDGDQSTFIEIRGSRGGTNNTRTTEIHFSNWDTNPGATFPLNYARTAASGSGRVTANTYQGYYVIGTNPGDSTNTHIEQGLFMDNNQNIGLGAIGTFGFNSLPTHRLDVDGDARIRTIPQVDVYDFILVTDNDGDVQKIDPSSLTGQTDLDWVVAGTTTTPPTALSDDIRTDGMVGIGMNPTSTINYGSGTITNVRLAVNGSIYCTGFASSSDARLKTNIAPLAGALDKLNRISGYSYDFIQDHGTVLDLPKGHQVGVLAQEIQSVVPEAVSELDNGYLAVNYNMLVPVLIESIKELSQQVEELKAAQAMSDPEATAQRRNSISQNFPNPTSGKTVFSLTLAEDVQFAKILITDLSGKLIDEVEVSGHGTFELSYDSHMLESGIYIYTLIADHQIVDSKRMVVSK